MRGRKYIRNATKLTRFLNLVVDGIVFNLLTSAVAFVVLLGMVMADQHARVESILAKANGVGAGILSLVLYIGYFAVFEISFGKTPAKFLTKTKVVDGRGDLPGWLDICGRSLCRIIPFDAFSFLVGKDWHDRFSNTSVVYDD
ncbi:RDD family protein [Pontiella sp.]|uniref:RDD family protein n=1 Tax=Pontiella sp. TaxID=2837462 RepID=UPI00356708AF